MTLDQWTEKYNRRAGTFEQPGYLRCRLLSANLPMTGQQAWELYHLDDHFVTSVEAGTIWLAPKTAETD